VYSTRVRRENRRFARQKFVWPLEFVGRITWRIASAHTVDPRGAVD
jgi:hypothetical protein